MMGLGVISTVVVVDGIAYALGWRPQLNQSRPTHTKQTPLELLKDRYARREITREQYELMKQDLG